VPLSHAALTVITRDCQFLHAPLGKTKDLETESQKKRRCMPDASATRTRLLSDSPQ